MAGHAGQSHFNDTTAESEYSVFSIDVSHDQDTTADSATGASRQNTLSNILPSVFSSGSVEPSPSLDLSLPTSNSSETLTALPRPSPASIRRGAARSNNFLTADDERSRIPRAEKDADDPTTPVTHSLSFDRSRENSTPTTLSKLFAANVSPVSSRHPSFIEAAGGVYTRSTANDSASLPDHLYTRGLLQGRHSDITVRCFGRKYALHRLILDRAPFFTTALSEPWLESSAKEIELHPEEIDANITQSSFELALKKLYGCDISRDEDSEAIGLFATGCWLEMQGLVDASIDSILRQMSAETLSPFIKLVTTNYYGQSGERILSSAKSMLCRDGWEMPIRHWDGIPGDVIREIIGGDGFFVDGEWERWALAKRLLDRRLRQQAVEVGLLEAGQRPDIRAPETLGLLALRFDTVYRQNAMTTGRQTPDTHAQWQNFYISPDIEPLLVLLDEGIHYVHMDFEQLQCIRKTRDVFGLPVLPEKVITNALWMQMELRQRVLTADDSDMELGLAKPIDTSQALPYAGASSKNGKQAVEEQQDLEEEGGMDSGSWDGSGKPRKFWIPSADCNIVMGGTAEPVVTTSNNFNRQAKRLSANMQPEDAQWATDFGSSPTNAMNPEGTARISTQIPGRPSSAGGSNAGQPSPNSFTNFPPFRFAVEFPNPRVLKEKLRVYSKTVFYAGSLWNIYIQKVRSSKNAQLGVYLHRAKESAEKGISASAGYSQRTVHQRISTVEREMQLQNERREQRRAQRRAREHDMSSQASTQQQSTTVAGEEETSGSGGDMDASPHIFGSVPRPRRRATLGGHDTADSPDVLDSHDRKPRSRSSSFSSVASSEPEVPNPSAHHDRSSTTLPAYVDARPTITTYFKIYSPSKGGRLLSVYESAPDLFNFSQSWGWKSSTLMLDESQGLGLGTGPGGDSGGAYGDGDDDETVRARRPLRSDGKLRFMVVIGNL